MKKRNILIISIVIVFILGVIGLLILKDNQEVRDTLPKEETTSYEEVMTLKDGRRVYSMYQDNTKLREKLEENNNYLDEVVKSINKKIILKDGGSVVYKMGDIYIVMCHSMSSVDVDKTIEDIYLGSSYSNICNK